MSLATRFAPEDLERLWQMYDAAPGSLEVTSAITRAVKQVGQERRGVTRPSEEARRVDALFTALMALKTRQSGAELFRAHVELQGVVADDNRPRQQSAPPATGDPAEGIRLGARGTRFGFFGWLGGH